MQYLMLHFLLYINDIKGNSIFYSFISKFIFFQINKLLKA